MVQSFFAHCFCLGWAIATLGSVVTLPAKVMATQEAFWYNCRTREVFTPEKRAWCDRWQVLQNATLTVPASLAPNPDYIQVTLKNGRYQRSDQKFNVELVNEKGWMAFGDLNGDGKTDAAAILGVALDPNGKSIGTYLTAVMDVDGKARSLAPTKLGERIRLNAPIRIADGSIVVPFLTMTEATDRIFVIHEMLREKPQISPR